MLISPSAKEKVYEITESTSDIRFYLLTHFVHPGPMNIVSGTLIQFKKMHRRSVLKQLP
jgi:hypothetical protein